MDDRVNVGCVRVPAGARDQPDLAMRLDPLPEQLDASLKNEVARHPLPDEVELVVLSPHVRAGGGKRILL